MAAGGGCRVRPQGPAVQTAAALRKGPERLQPPESSPTRVLFYHGIERRIHPALFEKPEFGNFDDCLKKLVEIWLTKTKDKRFIPQEIRVPISPP
ncbi:hypothetical protein TNIN_488621 [Trichonephila inaurata madagascariensis]|uniref:Uncharacterized protein n=1 Tax=Trichonephila inaurata madagascariensis TaxID=2747483 RepID=A0A8X7C0W2_9ARAC|nr:hypothetical protein TNIN_488621 [Trichonephila inaurata madagascariensis]